MVWNRIEYQEGDQIGRCTYLYDVAKLHGNRRAMFMCGCSKEFEAQISHVKRNNITSCGCYLSKTTTDRCTTHNLSGHPLYWKWGLMKDRCNNPNSKIYHYYGGRGIKVCDEWANDFKAYYDHVIALPNAMGNDLSIDRINNDGDYEPGNVRWATRLVQQNNRRKKFTKNQTT